MTLESHIENIIIGVCLVVWLFVISNLLKWLLKQKQINEDKKETRRKIDRVKELMRDRNNRIDFSRDLNLSQSTINGMALVELSRELQETKDKIEKKIEEQKNKEKK